MTSGCYNTYVFIYSVASSSSQYRIPFINRIQAPLKRIKARKSVVVYKTDEVYTKRSQGYYL